MNNVMLTKVMGDERVYPVAINGKFTCPECDVDYAKGEDLRLEAGMRCSRCSYGERQ